MDTDKLKKAVAMADALRHVFVATVGSEGFPHMAVAGKITLNSEGLLAVTSWFCPQTMLNLKENKNISLVVWDADSDIGFQLSGNLQDTEEVGILDGHDAKTESKEHFPQVQSQLLLRIDKVIEFKHAAHSDIE